MDSKEHRSALRAAVYRRDGPAVVDLLRGVGAYDDSLQLAGDGLIAALMQRVGGASELARDLVVALRQRGWDGDDELADQLDALLGTGPAPMLRALPVDLEELAGILEGNPLTAGGRIDIRTGEIQGRARTLARGARAVARTGRGAQARPRAIMARRSRLPLAARRPPRSLKPGQALRDRAELRDGSRPRGAFHNHARQFAVCKAPGPCHQQAE